MRDEMVRVYLGLCSTVNRSETLTEIIKEVETYLLREAKKLNATESDIKE